MHIVNFLFILCHLKSLHFVKPSSMGSLDTEATSSSSVPPSHVPVKRRQSSSTRLHYHYSPPSPTRPGLNASIHAPSPQRKGLNSSIHASISSSEESLCNSIYATSSPPRSDSRASYSSPTRRYSSASIHAPSSLRSHDLNASIHAPSSSPPSRDSSTSIHAPNFPSRRDSSTSIHASASLPRSDLGASIHAPRTPPKRSINASIHAPRQDEPVEPMPIPVVDLSPDRRIRGVIDPRRE